MSYQNSDNQCCRGNDDRRYNRRPRILLGITGSVAAVKGPKLALRLANELKAHVKVILTRTVEQYFWKEGKAVPSYDAESWNEFINVVVPSTATTTSIVVAGTNDEEDLDWRLSNGKISIHYAEEEWANYTSLQDSVLHIDLRNWADVCLIAPLSAHTLSKIANGLCDDLLTCCLRAWDYGQRNNKSLNNSDGTIGIGKPIILAPAMNTAMWDHPLTSWQLETIKKFTRMKKDDDESNNQEEENGVYIVEPAVKTLACGEIGAGALADLDDIISAVKRCLAKWENKSNVSSIDSSSCTRKESMKRALLRHAKQRFSDMKSSHEQQLAAPISPTDIDIIETFLPRLNLNSNSLLVDLGCGDGRWLIAANKHTQCKCLGIDVDEERLRIAQESILEFDLQNMIKVRNQDVFEFVRESDDFFDANVLIIYLFREAMMKIGALMQHRLDTRGDGKNDDASEEKKLQILCVGFALPGWTYIHEEKVNGKRVYLYST